MERTYFLEQLEHAFRVNPVVAILGPRQCGKTTLAQQFLKRVNLHKDKVHYFDLEDPSDQLLMENPKTILGDLEGFVIIDEIQKAPNLFSTLRVLVDQKNRRQKYLILGSASQELIQQSSETLAGRIEYLELTPFSTFEVLETKKLWIRGGYPLSYLSGSLEDSYRWRENYIRAFLERDIPSLGIKIAPANMRRFWMTLAHYHGNLFNASELGRSLSLSAPTIKHYADILSGTFMIRQLQPWHENIGKRQVKSPKIYFRDSGIFHSLIDIENEQRLLRHPKLAASWEGFALEEIIRYHHAREGESFFWATQDQAELDLLIVKKGQKLGFEFKFSDTPKPTRSVHHALSDLKLDKITIIYPGDKRYKISDVIEVCGLEVYLISIK